ncbi:MAG: hypothetical protein WA874_19865 [Chryseosolibacter sp.]
MKTVYIALILTLLASILSTTVTKATTGFTILRDSTVSIEVAKILLIRMDEINALDRESLTSSEVRALRKELRLIKGNLKELEKGTYMPAGKLIIILLIPLVIFNISD